MKFISILEENMDNFDDKLKKAIKEISENAKKL